MAEGGTPQPDAPRAKLLPSKRTSAFKKLFERLPLGIQSLAEAAFAVFEQNPLDPRLKNEPLHDSSKGSHRNGSRSVNITQRYRAVYVVDRGQDGQGPEQNCWYWIGSHEDYNTFVGSRRR